MKVFAQNVRAGQNTPVEEWAKGYARLAAEGPVDDEYGICYNVSKVTDSLVADVCGYNMTEQLFSCVLGECFAYPLTRETEGAGWDIRRKWCAAFAASFRTGEIEVDEEMEKSLVGFVDVDLIIR